MLVERRKKYNRKALMWYSKFNKKFHCKESLHIKFFSKFKKCLKINVQQQQQQQQCSTFLNIKLVFIYRWIK